MPKTDKRDADLPLQPTVGGAEGSSSLQKFVFPPEKPGDQEEWLQFRRVWIACSPYLPCRCCSGCCAGTPFDASEEKLDGIVQAHYTGTAVRHAHEPQDSQSVTSLTRSGVII